MARAHVRLSPDSFGATLFDLAPLPPATRQHPFLSPGASPERRALLDQESTRELCIPPLHVSSLERSELLHDELRHGWATMAGRDVTTGGLQELKPQQWMLHDVLAATREDGRPLYTTTGIIVPRRASKSTTLWATAMGRCLLRPGYVVLYAAQSGIKSRERFLDLQRAVDRYEADDDARGFRVMKGAGYLAVEFANGSLIRAVPPKGDNFRGDAGDLLLLDEAQEHDDEVSADLLSGILPTMDTRPDAQLVVVGTAGTTRRGIFWRTLEDGRAGKPRTGILEFAAPADTPLPIEGEPVDGTAADPQLWARVHPGIGTLTTAEVVADRYDKLGVAKFAREYLNLWPEDYSQSAIDSATWRAGAQQLDDHPKPDHFALSYDVAVDGSTAAIVAAWRQDGRAFVEVIRHAPSPGLWLRDELLRIARDRRAPIGHDSMGAVLNEAEELQRARPRPRLEPLGLRDIVMGSAAFERDLREGRLVHFDQAPLNMAALGVAKRKIGDTGWAWGRLASAGTDITPLIAATNALRTFDRVGPARRRPRIIMAGGA